MIRGNLLLKLKEIIVCNPWSHQEIVAIVSSFSMLIKFLCYLDNKLHYTIVK